uniref:Uncharacterized protein n=1 Tax=Anguilla anguilla TaxID=7936 RepID=A0A0E9Q668_ANGAN
MWRLSTKGSAILKLQWRHWWSFLGLCGAGCEAR